MSEACLRVQAGETKGMIHKVTRSSGAATKTYVFGFGFAV
jgi:hypothetical protein